MLKAFANAKINLLLDITGREENGYHTVNNIMQTVSLCDTVTLSCECKGIKIEYSDGYEVGPKDICLKAATEYQRLAKRDVNADIFIEKVIPTAAGLGGNSSAAAAVLMLLQSEYRMLDDEQLLEIAKGLGADVPFFLIGGTALCEHYGETVTSVDSLPECYVVIAKKGAKSSTADMYRKIDNAELSQKGDLEGILAMLKNKDLDAVCEKMFNVFEKVSQSEDVEKIRSIMLKSSAKAAMLSGSGPAVFGIFNREDTAKAVCEALVAAGVSAYLCKTEKVGIRIE